MKKLILFTFILSLAQTSIAQNGTTLKDRNGCQFIIDSRLFYPLDSSPELLKTYSLKWTGKCFFNFLEGHGILGIYDQRNKRKWKYEGDIKEGRISGYGRMSKDDYMIYSGEWKGGKRDGEGKYNHRNGNSYIGGWKNGKEHGEGIGNYPYTSGESYSGEWKNGEKHGEGKYNYKNGDSYTGELKNGVRHGEGKYNFKNGASYTGGWKNGEMHDQGVFIDRYGNKEKRSYIRGKENTIIRCPGDRRCKPIKW